MFVRERAVSWTRECAEFQPDFQHTAAQRRVDFALFVQLILDGLHEQYRVLQLELGLRVCRYAGGEVGLRVGLGLGGGGRERERERESYMGRYVCA